MEAEEKVSRRHSLGGLSFNAAATKYFIYVLNYGNLAEFIVEVGIYVNLFRLTYCMLAYTMTLLEKLSALVEKKCLSYAQDEISCMLYVRRPSVRRPSVRPASVHIFKRHLL